MSEANTQLREYAKALHDSGAAFKNITLNLSNLGHQFGKAALAANEFRSYCEKDLYLRSEAYMKSPAWVEDMLHEFSILKAGFVRRNGHFVLPRTYPFRVNLGYDEFVKRRRLTDRSASLERLQASVVSVWLRNSKKQERFDSIFKAKGRAPAITLTNTLTGEPFWEEGEQS